MIVGEKVIIDFIEEADLEFIHKKMYAIDDLSVLWPLMIKSLTQFKKEFLNDGFWSPTSGKLKIVEKQSKKIVGMLLFFKHTNHYNSLEIGYQIFDLNDFRKGYCSEAVKLLSPLLFESFPIERLQICTPTSHIASRRVAEKCGFTYEGTLRRVFFLRGKYVDLDVHSLLKSEVHKLKTLEDRHGAS